MAIVLPMQRFKFEPCAAMISCKECGNTNSLVSDYAAGDLICIKCGCVAARGVQDEGSDCRLYSDGKEVKGAQHAVTFGELGSAEIKCSRPVQKRRSRRSIYFALFRSSRICAAVFFCRKSLSTRHSLSSGRLCQYHFWQLL